eukprot:CAMPEP_0206586422 /NCGR_PEP_ID=MMETSP0325_2-20121206/37013_1 /ASSEMBLY_ACC=CAM_ASM_000347 /TAXON_ID=2866 /ORGANISM="Crypthecodinium cohnii, Strain Seligo" /LENGTH=244 /DNA_ID=CAMNT_0054094177 /DNA_START=23 /DNA_END=758 /DNA_ORIENTATION=+
MGRSESRGSRSPSRSRRKGGGGSGGRETGTVNTWNTDKQFGFVSCTSSNRADLFLHAEYFDSVDHRNRVKTRGLRRGDRIEFTIEDVPGKKSAQAMHADLLESSRRSPSSSRSRSRGRRAPPPPRPRAQIEFRPGDWDCPSCHFHNFARNSNCMKCDTSKDGDDEAGREEEEEEGEVGGAEIAEVAGDPPAADAPAPGIGRGRPPAEGGAAAVAAGVEAEVADRPRGAAAAAKAADINPSLSVL